MRSAILLASLVIASAINSDTLLYGKGGVVLIALMLYFSMDMMELVKKK